MCSAVPIILGVLSAGLSIAQQQQQVRAQNAAIDHQNAVQEQNFQFNKLNAEARRQNEEQQRQLQEDLMYQTTELANKAYENDINQANLRHMQEEEATGQRKRMVNIQALEAKGGIIAARGGGGASILNLIADVKRRQGWSDYYEGRNFAFTGQQIVQSKKAKGIERSSRIASKSPYLKRTILDPIEPLKRAHVKGPGFIGFASAALGGVQTGMGVYNFGHSNQMGWVTGKTYPG